MLNTYSEISFTYYNKSNYILHTNSGHHYIISKQKKAEIEDYLKSNIVNHKMFAERIDKLKENKRDKTIYISDFQFKIPIISGHYLFFISSSLSFLFEKYIFIIISSTLTFFLSYFYLFSKYNNNNSLTSHSLKFMWIIPFLVFFMHEIGHAAACCKFKGKPGAIGFGITSFFPVLYADVSDSWRLTKYERIIVNLGGVYFQNILSMFFLLAWFISRNIDFFLIGKLYFISSVYQIFPYHKTDGYWILSDIISEPNLFKISRKLFYLKIKNPLLKLSKRYTILLLYYIFISCTIIYFIVFFGFKYFISIIGIPNYVRDMIINIVHLNFDKLYFSQSYLWALLYIIFTTKIIINNYKNYILSNGADRI